MSKNRNSARLGGDGTRRPRRELLAGAAGALGAVAVETLGRTAPARAATGDPVVQGTDNGPAGARTKIFTDSDREFASLADPNTSGKGSLGIYGHGQDVGVLGEGAVHFGVLGNGGRTGDGAGVVGNGGGGGAGVFGTGGPDSGDGVVGRAGSGGGDGVVGRAGMKGTGVSGSGAIGVSGSTGVAGGVGVEGATDAVGGVGVRAENFVGGTALEVSGRAAFSSSGVLTVGAGRSRITRTGVALTGASLVLATLQQDVAGVYVRSLCRTCRATRLRSI